MNETIPFRDNSVAADRPSCRLTIDLGAIVANWRDLGRLSGKARTAAVVKADAYGLGATEIGQALLAAGCGDFFVATPEEGARLRRVAPAARIFVLNGIWSGIEQPFFTHRLIPVIGSMEQLAFFLSLGHGNPYALFVDTGMNRLGLSMEDAAAVAGRQDRDKPELLLSHLACSDQHDHAMNRRQCGHFHAIAELFDGVEASLSSSGGIFLGPDYHFDLTRPGISLYGGAATSGVENPLRPVVEAEALILQIRSVRKGEVASYGATHVFERDSRVAIVGAGYADGWHRALSGSGVAVRQNGSAGGFVSVAGERAPIVGRITMDLTTIDIGHMPESRVKTGDYVELLGENANLDDVARAAGTISYELLTSLGRRYARRHV